MGKAAIRLPEKSYFSPAEIAERWGCPVERVMHYMNEGQLRPALLSAELFEWMHNIAEASAPLVYLSPDDWPHYFYLASTPEAIEMRFERRPGFSLKQWNFDAVQVEDIDGRVYWLLDASGKRRAYNANHLITESYFAPTGGVYTSWEWKQDAVIITRDERDRFEREHGVIVDGQEIAAKGAEPQQEAPAGGLVFPYATKELEAMREAVTLYWEDYTPDKRLPTQKEIAYTLGELLGLSQQSNGDPARKAITLATAIKPDTLPDT